ncbi:MobF family relaxase (plasmid) [Prescottella equi]|uniref:MobF family relaxase n=1 Tax=Rhodococcus hoagii TaxID=43767 RepID=UPI0025786B6F|nr:MobF family relaxase [Prescottella equi]WJJ14633.1 MobF family relaxase [Prescottella equi]
MSAKKLTAGDGYEYLTRQVAAADSTELGRSTLSDYYSAKGESPGRWMGSGLESLTGVETGETVSSEQMRALFGEGRHPNATEIEKRLVAEGIARGLDKEAATRQALVETKLGNPFRIYAGETEFRQLVAERFADYNVARGESANARIDDAMRAEIRTQVGQELFAKEYGRSPANEAELSGFIAKGSRQKTTAVAGYDLTFTPVKSVSTLWAVAPREVSEQIEDAHHAAVQKAIAFVEKNATYTRLGTDGVQQVDVDGLLCAAFTHRDSRAGDPNLHTHVAISNKVHATDSGRWLALDGRPLHKLFVAASEVYNTELESEMRTRVGVQFAERGQTENGKRPIREIVGVDSQLNEVWSSRRAMIEARRGELAAQFQREHGREPTPIEAIALAQQANLDTREAKHEPKSHAEQREEWRATALQVLGGEQGLSDMVRMSTHPSRSAPRTAVTESWIQQAAAQIIDTVSEHQSRWQEAHLIAEAQRVVRAANLPADRIQPVVDRLVSATKSPEMSVALGREDDLNEPDVLRRRDGSSVYSTAGTQLYTSESVLAAEQRIVDAALRTNGRRASEMDVDLALLEQAANDFELNAGQTALVRAMATSGARVQLALAPAGTGKTSAMATYARAWENSGGNVIGLAPTAAAAATLRKDLGATTDTMGKLIHTLKEQPFRKPEWFDQIGPDTVVVVDEAGMASTADLDRVIEFVLERGGSVRLVGDDQQLASVSAGGVLRDVASSAGAVTLTEVVRFKDPAEGVASIALREGDPAAIGFYVDQGRVHVADKVAAEELAYGAWQSDRAEGLDAVMLAPTRDMVRGLNERARTDRLALNGGVTGLETTLSDGLNCSAGDIISTRLNDRRLALTRTDFVRNGDRWTVDEVHQDGSLTVTHIGTSRSIQLPADYVAENTTLGYARTIHGAQGITADTCHTVATGTENRQLAYVALTRGKRGNDVYFGTANDGDPENVIDRETLLPRTAVDIFTDILARDGAQKSATTTARALDDPAQRIAHAAAAYDDAVGTAAEHTIGAEELARIDAAAEDVWKGLTDQAAYPVLRKHLAIIAVGGDDAVEMLRAAAASRELDTAADVAAVLDWRLDPSGEHSAGTGPLPWLPAVPAALAADEKWGAYLRRRADLVSDLADKVAVQTEAFTLDTAPRWARPLLGVDPRLVRDLAVWRASFAVDEADRRPTGPERYAAAQKRHQHRLDKRATEVLGQPNAAASRWRSLAESVEPRLLQDPFWPELADRLALTRRSGVDVHTLVRRAVADRPLPVEMPAAALWWRLSRELKKTEFAATIDAGHSPTWSADLAELFGRDGADALTADPAWTKLVAVIDAADTAEWTPQELLALARDLAVDGQDGANLDPTQLATALPWRVEAVLAHSTPVPGEGEIEPVSPEAEEAAAAAAGVWLVEDAPTDAHLTTRPAATERTEPEIVADDEIEYDVAQPTDTDAPLDPDLPPAPADYEFDRTDERGLLTPADAAELDSIDDWAAELLAQARSTAADRYVELPPAERLERLQRDLADARTRLAALWQATLDGTTEHLSAAMPMLTEMQQRADAQRPFAAEAAYAHRRWTEAALESEAADNTVARLTREAHAAREAGDDDTAAHLEADLALAETVADAATAAARAEHAEYEQAQQRLVQAADGAAGIVTSEDVQVARLTVMELDERALAEARRDVEQLKGAVVRAEAAGARDFAETASAEHPVILVEQRAPEQAVQMITAPTIVPEQTQTGAVDVAAVEARVRQADKVVQTPTPELKSRIKQTQLNQRMNPTQAADRYLDRYHSEMRRRAELPRQELAAEDSTRQRMRDEAQRAAEADGTGVIRNRDRDHQLPRPGREQAAAAETPAATAEVRAAAADSPSAQAGAVDAAAVEARVRQADKVVQTPTSELKSRIKQTQLNLRMNPTDAGRANLDRYRAEYTRRAELPREELAAEEAARQRIRDENKRTDTRGPGQDTGPDRRRDRGLER